MREILAEAGKKFDGHVTMGSLDAQLKALKMHLGVLVDPENYGTGKRFVYHFHVQEFVNTLLEEGIDTFDIPEQKEMGKR